MAANHIWPKVKAKDFVAETNEKNIYPAFDWLMNQSET